MVFFNCSTCGEALKKNQVDNHWKFKCKKCDMVSCVDCGTEFWGNTYTEHTKCITEDEKYGGKNYKPKASANKGERKQEEWVNRVQQAIAKAKANPKLQTVLHRLEDYPNIPRKQAKFENFLKSSLKVFPPMSIEVWKAINDAIPPMEAKQNSEDIKSKEDTIENTEQVKAMTKKEKKEERRKKQCKQEKKDKKSEENGADLEDKQSVEETNGFTKLNKKKRKREECEEATEMLIVPEQASKKKKKKKLEENSDTPDMERLNATLTEDEMPRKKFNWECVILLALRSAEDKELPIKKLKKKVISEFWACGGSKKPHSDNDLKVKFEKKISRHPHLKILKDMVKLCE